MIEPKSDEKIKVLGALNAQALRSMKIAFLPSSTMKGFDKTLCERCWSRGIAADVYVGQYNNYAQEILNSASALYQHEPEIIFLYIDAMSLFRDLDFDYYAFDYPTRKKIFDDTLTQINLLLNTLKQRTGARIVLHNFAIPSATIMGILETKQEFGLCQFYQALNTALADTTRADDRIILFDFDQLCSRLGKEKIFNWARYYLADITLDMGFWSALVEEYVCYLVPQANQTKKCIVLDLDNTLWGGIIGEDGIQNIRLGPVGVGRPFYEFQKYLLALYKRGVILAINSKNNLNDALNVFRQHPHMILREEHFAAMQINWNDKVANMRALAKEINIGLDSFVFVDDDPLNCEMVSMALPEVKVINIPKDAAQILSVMTMCKEFNTFHLTDEDRQRGAMYAAQRQRAQLSEASPDIDNYLQQLHMVVTFEEVSDFNLPRLAQLTQKTNQFNMTTRRYSEQAVREMMQNSQYVIRVVDVKDKFGENGITGAIIMRQEGNQMLIDTLLLSCRVIGRKVENVILAEALSLARQANCYELVGEFIATEKNAPAKDFYRQAGFDLIEQTNGKEVWRMSTQAVCVAPNFIQVMKR